MSTKNVSSHYTGYLFTFNSMIPSRKGVDKSKAFMDMLFQLAYLSNDTQTSFITKAPLLNRLTIGTFDLY